MVQKADGSGVCSFPKGSVISSEGPAAARDMVVLLHGSAGVYKNYGTAGEQQLEVISQGGVYGELSLFLNEEKNSSLVALSDVMALLLSRRNLEGFFAGQPKLAVSVVEGICRKLRNPRAELPVLPSAARPAAPVSKTGLLPEKHGDYTLNLLSDSPALYLQQISCPLCGRQFEQLSVLSSQLGRATTDPDLRIRYSALDPMYYEITTCPECLLSTPSDMFLTVERRRRAELDKAVGPFRLDTAIRTGRERDTFTVFAGFFLALLTAPAVFYEPQLITSNLWLKIARLYRDCDDEELYLWASKKALEGYNYVNLNMHTSAKQSQQISFILGDLYFRIGDTDSAGKFFFDIKTDKTVSPALARLADLRLDDIRDIRAAERAANEKNAARKRK